MTLLATARLYSSGASPPSPPSIATYSATVINEYAEEDVFEDDVMDIGARAIYTATVSRSVTDSWDRAPEALWYRPRVVLNGQAVPEEDLVGGIRVSFDENSHLALCEFQLAGKSYSVFKTLSTWTKVPVEVYIDHGAADQGEDAMFTDPLFSGVVRSPASQSCTGQAPLVRIRAASDAALYDRADLCYELEPFAGKTRGEIVREVCLAAGITLVDVPDGAVYEKPVFTDQKRIHEFLSEFGSPEGWRWRVRFDGTLEAYISEIALPPFPADHVWHVDDVESITVETPSEPPSRWIARGMSAVFVDEVGLTVTSTELEVKGIYAPKVAVYEQQDDGDIDPTGFSLETERLITVSRLVDTVTKRGNKVVGQNTREWGWYNPKAARLRTARTGETWGAGPADGYYYPKAYIDESGAFVTWHRERFVQTAERRVVFGYDLEGNKVSSQEDRLRWYSRTAGVSRIGFAGVSETGIGDDDGSYARAFLQFNNLAKLQLELFGLAESVTTTYQYDEESGAAVNETSTVKGYYAPRGAVDQTGYYLRFDGTAQTELIANWRTTSITSRTNVVQAGRLLGLIESESGYGSRKIIGGSYDWGDFESNDNSEEFKPIRVVNTTYNKISETSYEEVVFSGSGVAKINIRDGKVPLPRFKVSPWTLLLQSPIETVIDDEVAEALWGFQRQVLNTDHAQTLAELEAMIERRRFRALARTLTIRRPATTATEGDTVLLIDPRQGIYHRALVTAHSIEASTARVAGVYQLKAVF